MSDFLIENWAVILDASAKVLGCLALWLAYLRYKHSVELAKRKERRSAIELAARECARYGTELLAKILELSKEIETCNYIKRCKIIHDDQQIRLDTSEVMEDDKRQIMEYAPKIVNVMNSMEGFAIPFASNVADDGVGFVECGRAFVDHFERMFPLYCLANLQQYYQASQHVYWRWKKRLRQQELEQQHLQVGKEFFILSERLLSSKSNSWLARSFAEKLRAVAKRLSKS
jgi:hypothetical protein